MRKTGCCIVALVAGWIMCQAQILVNGRSIIHDAIANQWVCTIPDSCFGTDYEAQITITPESQWSGVVVDGIPVGDGESIWFTQLDGLTQHTLHANIGDSIINGTLTFSCLPLLVINAPVLSPTYNGGTFHLYQPDSIAPLDLQGRIKWRGRTTLMNSRHKKNFHIKIEDENGDKKNVKLMGMRNDNSWLLDGGQTDLSRIRNHVAHQLWLDMAEKPYYADREPNARSACRGEMVELFVNGNYEGIYTLMEAMDRKQMKLAKYETDTVGNHIIHGQLWKAVTYGNGTLFCDTVSYDNYQTSWFGFDTKYPELEEVSPTDYSILANAVALAAKGYDSKWRREAPKFYDLPVMRDYMIFTFSLLAIDNTAKNIYWAVYDKAEDKKLTLAVWDLDCTVGQDWTNTPFRPEDRVGPEKRMSVNNLIGRLYVLIDDFHQDVFDRYHALRKDILNPDSLTYRYTSLINHLQFAGATQRESKRWDGDSDLGGHILDWESEKNYISNWIKRRIKYLDENVFPMADISSIKQDYNNDSEQIYNLMGQPMRKDNLSPGIYLQSGKKIVISQR